MFFLLFDFPHGDIVFLLFYAIERRLRKLFTNEVKDILFLWDVFCVFAFLTKKKHFLKYGNSPLRIHHHQYILLSFLALMQHTLFRSKLLCSFKTKSDFTRRKTDEAGAKQTYYKADWADLMTPPPLLEKFRIIFRSESEYISCMSSYKRRTRKES